MGLIDVFLVPVFALVFIVVAYFIRPWLTTPATRKYFISSLVLKLIGALAVGVIYHFYYQGGDTVNYYENATHLREAIIQKPFKGIEMLLSSTFKVDIDGGEFSKGIYFRDDPASLFVVKISAVLGLLCFNSYSCIAMFFAVLSFSGVWMLYQYVYVDQYPERAPVLALAMLFVPSLFFWGSGVLKDTLTLAAMCWLIWALYRLFVKGRLNPLLVFVIVVSAYVLAVVKVYILLCLVPMIGVWLYLNYMHKIRSWKVKFVLSPVLLVVLAVGAIYMSSSLASINEKYNYDNIVETAKVTSWWLRKAGGESASSYRLSEPFDGSLQSLLVLGPQAINVTYFRPYLWEVRNPVMLMSAIESFGFLMVTMFLLIEKKRFDPLVVSGLIFSLMFAIAVGISTSNFGALVRYKIPCLIIYAASLAVIKRKTPKET